MDTFNRWRVIAWILFLAATTVIGFAYFRGRSPKPVQSPSPQSPAAAMRQLRPEPLPKSARPTPIEPIKAANLSHGKPPSRLADDFAQLKQKAQSGDGVAASELYRQLNACSKAKLVNWRSMNSYVSSMAAAADSRTDLGNVGPINAAAQADADRMAATESLCDGATDEMLRELASTTLEAAKLGDADARACYIHRGPFVDPTAVLDNPSLLANYRSDTTALVEDAIDAGDWRVVAMLMHAYANTGSQMLTGVTGFDPVMAYQMRKLWSLGLPSRYEEYNDSPLAQARLGLTDDQLAQADTAAQITFDNNFRTSGNPALKVSGTWDACEINLQNNLDQ
jgi:hypothetical protein